MNNVWTVAVTVKFFSWNECQKKEEEGKHKTQIADADNSYPNRYL